MNQLLLLSIGFAAVTGFAAVVASAPPPTGGADASPTLEQLMALENGAMERWRNGDPMGWAAIAAPEVTYVDPGLTKPIVGIEEYARYLEGLKGKIVYDGSEFIRPKVAAYGDLAVLTYNYRSTTRAADGTNSQGPLWNTTEVYARVAGAWKIVHTHWSLVDHVLPDALEIPFPVELRAKRDVGVLGELTAIESSAMERWRKGDPFGFVEASAPEVTYFDSGTPERRDGRAALEREYRKLAGTVRFEAMEFLEPRVQLHGDAAVLFYRFLSTRLRGDGSVERRTPWNCTEIYAKHDGAWKIVHTHWSLINGRTRRAGGTGNSD